MDQLRKAAEAVITHVVGDLPVHGWLSDNDASRRALSQLRAALAAAPAAVVQAEPSEATGSSVEVEQLRAHVAELQKALRLSADDHDDTAHIIGQNAPKENVLRSIALKAKFARALLPTSVKVVS